jgi:hypothetical protein
MNVFDRLVEGVTEAGSTEAAVERLMHNLANELRICIGNDSALESLANALGHFDNTRPPRLPVVHALAERVLLSQPTA